MKKNNLKTIATVGVMFIGLAVIFVCENVSKLWDFNLKARQPQQQPDLESSLETSQQNAY